MLSLRLLPILSRFVCAACILVSLAAVAKPGRAQPPAETPKTPQLQIAAIDIAAANGSASFVAEQLCQLQVSISNSGGKPAFSLAFEVEIGGHKLPVYDQQLFMVPVADNQNANPFKLDLFNFWTSDSRRPAPKDGKLSVTVRLVEAQWLKISEEKEGEETVEVWTPLGAVDGLPSELTTTIQLATR